MDELRTLLGRLDELTRRFEAVAELERENRDQEVRVLDSLLARIQPLMSFVDERIKVEVTIKGGGENRIEDIVDYEENGVLLYNRFGKTGVVAGEYTGDQLWFTRTGQLILVERSGDYDFSPNGNSRWVGEVREVNRLDALEEFPLLILIKSIVRNFEKAEATIDNRFRQAQEYQQTLAMLDGALKSHNVKPLVEVANSPFAQALEVLTQSSSVSQAMMVAAPIDLSAVRRTNLAKAREAKKKKREAANNR